MQRVSKTIGLFLTLLGASAGAVTVRPLSAAELKKLQAKPCALVHLWAAWCGPCVQELPELLHGLAGLRDVEPVVIDVSPPEMQTGRSLALLQRIAPPYPVFRAPTDKDLDGYLRVVDAEFDGALPFSVLYGKGKKKKAWSGPLDIDELKRVVAAACK